MMLMMTITRAVYCEQLVGMLPGTGFNDDDDSDADDDDADDDDDEADDDDEEDKGSLR